MKKYFLCALALTSFVVQAREIPVSLADVPESPSRQTLTATLLTPPPTILSLHGLS